MSQPETARELIGKARSYRCSDQPCRCPACELARRVERVLDCCEREAVIKYPGAWAPDILALLNGEGMCYCKCHECAQEVPRG